MAHGSFRRVRGTAKQLPFQPRQLIPAFSSFTPFRTIYPKRDEHLLRFSPAAMHRPHCRTQVLKSQFPRADLTSNVQDLKPFQPPRISFTPLGPQTPSTTTPTRGNQVTQTLHSVEITSENGTFSFACFGKKGLFALMPSESFPVHVKQIVCEEHGWRAYAQSPTLSLPRLLYRRSSDWQPCSLLWWTPNEWVIFSTDVQKSWLVATMNKILNS